MRVQRVIDQATETVVYARQLNSLRADREAFPNADEFFRAGFGGGGGNHLIEVKGPFVERVLPPRQSDQTWQDLATELDLHDAMRGAVLDILFGDDPEGRLYVHQERALRSMLEPSTSPGLILAIPTATGKTESFLIPLLQKLLAPPRAPTPLRAVVIYPTKTLEADQLNRILRFVHAINRRLPAGVRRLRIGIWDGDTPYELVVDKTGGDAGDGDAGDPAQVVPLRLGDPVRGLECPRPECARKDAKLRARLPAAGYLLACALHPNDPIEEVSYARQALGKPGGAVDVVFTTPEALEHALASRSSWLRRHLVRANLEYLVYDEVHVWAGTGGVAIRLLNQRLLAMFQARGASPRIVLASATVGEPARLFRDLTGLDGEVVAFEGESTAHLAGPLVLPAGFRPVPLVKLIATMRGDAIGSDLLIWGPGGLRGVRVICLQR